MGLPILFEKMKYYSLFAIAALGFIETALARNRLVVGVNGFWFGNGGGYYYERRKPACSAISDWRTVSGRCVDNQRFTLTCEPYNGDPRRNLENYSCASSGVFNGYDRNKITCIMRNGAPECVYIDDRDPNDPDDGEVCSWGSGTRPSTVTSSGSGVWSGTSVSSRRLQSTCRKK